MGQLFANQTDNQNISHHAAERWAAMARTIVHSPVDIPTVPQWAQVVGLSRAALHARCAVAGVTAKQSLDLARLFRLVVRANNTYRWEPFDVLDVIDTRTISRMLHRGHIGGLLAGPIPSPHAFLLCQRFVTSPANLAAFKRAIAQAPMPRR